MKKHRCNIYNLDCANCARQVEDHLNKCDDLKNVVVNFSTSKITYESEEEIPIEEMNRRVKEVEPDSKVSKTVEEEKKEFHVTTLVLGIVLGLLGALLPVDISLKYILYFGSYTLLLYRTAINAVKLLFKSFTLNENALITISCIGAFLIGEPLEEMMVIALYTIGKLLEERAVANSRKSIADLVNIKEPFANKKDGRNIVKVEVERVEVGDVLVVKKGEKIPTDGIILKGSTTLDTSLLTGESDLMEAGTGDDVLSGSINMGDVVEIEVTNTFKESTVAKILELLEEASDKKAKVETTVSKISKVYTPVIFFLSILVALVLPVVFHVEVRNSIYRALTFLVISCPCAIAISVPLSYFTGLGVASKRGILIKGSNYLDTLSNAKSIIFDKTGTLTTGSFSVSSIAVDSKDYSKSEVIDILVSGESFSNHPIAKSIMKLKSCKIDASKVKNFKELEGKGIAFEYENKKILVGNRSLCKCRDICDIHLNIEGKHVASLMIDDGIKPQAKETIGTLKKSGLKTYMFTGDRKEVAMNIGEKLEIDVIKYEMLPSEKYEQFENVSGDGITIFVGDGVNDAPVLKRADLGISMGGVGSESAIEASDIVLMSDDLSKITEAIEISKYTKSIIKENLVFAVGTKAIILLLSVFGFANMWAAVFADTGVTLLTILNTLRILKKFKV